MKAKQHTILVCLTSLGGLRAGRSHESEVDGQAVENGRTHEDWGPVICWIGVSTGNERRIENRTAQEDGRFCWFFFVENWQYECFKTSHHRADTSHRQYVVEGPRAQDRSRLPLANSRRPNNRQFCSRFSLPQYPTVPRSSRVETGAHWGRTSAPWERDDWRGLKMTNKYIGESWLKITWYSKICSVLFWFLNVFKWFLLNIPGLCSYINLTLHEYTQKATSFVFLLSILVNKESHNLSSHLNLFS